MKYGIAIIGCGYISDIYYQRIKQYPELEITGVFDTNQKRAEKFGQVFSLRVYRNLTELLADSDNKLIINLTSPESHYSVSKACLLAGKHVYSEKPLTMDLTQSRELIAMAEKNHLSISSAPCSLLGTTAQTLWKALKNNEIGRVRLVYAEIDDGMIHRMPINKWENSLGIPWPYRNEFIMGCTYEHAGYYLTWLAAFFGPAKTITGYSSCVIEDKHILPEEILRVSTPDFTVSCIEFESGVIARLTVSIVATHNHSLRLFGDDGILSVDECWNIHTPVYKHSYTILGERVIRYPLAKKLPILQFLGGNRKRKLKPVKRQNPLLGNMRTSHHDYAQGIAEQCRAIEEKRRNHIPADFVLHINELTIAIQNSNKLKMPYCMTTSFEPLHPI